MQAYQQQRNCCCQTKTGQLHRKSVAAKVITTFLALILTVNNLIFNSKFTYKSKAVPWKQYPVLHTQTYSCQSSKRNTYILSLKANLSDIQSSKLFACKICANFLQRNIFFHRYIFYTYI